MNIKEEYDQNESAEGAAPVLDPKTTKYIEELTQEKHMLGPQFSHAARLVQDEIQNIIAAGRGRPARRYVDVYHERPTKVLSKVIVPLKDHPKFNYVGKLLGPKGNTLRRLQEETQTKMAILGRGSMKDKIKEEELRQSLDPKYLHLSDDLHVEISALAPPAEAHARVAYALAELRKYLVPDSNDDIAAQQRDEMEEYGDDGNGHEAGDNTFTRRETNFYDRAPQSNRGGYGGGSSHGRGGGGGRGDGGGRGGRGGPPKFGRPSGGFGGQDRQPALHRDGPVGRGRGAPRGRGSGSSQMYPNPNHRPDNYSDDSYQNSFGNNSAPQQSRGFGNQGGNDYERRNTFTDMFQSKEESGRGGWKPRGGLSRFSERSVPYTRRT